MKCAHLSYMQQISYKNHCKEICLNLKLNCTRIKLCHAFLALPMDIRAIHHASLGSGQTGYKFNQNQCPAPHFLNCVRMSARINKQAWVLYAYKTGIESFSRGVDCDLTHWGIYGWYIYRSVNQAISRPLETNFSKIFIKLQLLWY